MTASNNTLEFKQELDTDEPPCSNVVMTVCAVTGKDPMDAPPLADYIDPDCLNQLFRGERQPVVKFHYDGHDIVVEQDSIRVLDS